MGGVGVLGVGMFGVFVLGEELRFFGMNMGVVRCLMFKVGFFLVGVLVRGVGVEGVGVWVIGLLFWGVDGFVLV